MKVREELNMYEKKGITEFNNKKWIWEALLNCNSLYGLIANNMDEIPNISDIDLYMFVQTLLQVKYSLIELIGRDIK